MDLSIYKGLSINGIPLKELRANGKLIWSALVKWAKYSCNVIGHYEDTEVNEEYSNSWYDSTITLFDSFEYSSEDGYIGIGSNVFTVDDDLTEAVGKYHVTDERVIEITALSLGNGTSRYFFDYEGTKVRERIYVNDSYSQGSIFYGTVEAKKGDLPEIGNLVVGSAEQGVCVLEIGGTYFYYVLKND